MNTDIYNCITIDTYTDICPILVVGQVLTLTRLCLSFFLFCFESALLARQLHQKRTQMKV